VLVLEASVAALHQMFLDFALLTEKQGESLDQIEFQVKSASEYIEDGDKDMVQAIEIQKSLCKKQCCIIVTCLVIIGIIVAIVIATQSAQGKLSTSAPAEGSSHARSEVK
jgi:t-SNARE complex subunit (syntaxin)